MNSPPTAIIAAAHARSMSARELGEFIVSECREICKKLASLEPYVRVAFEHIDKGEAICGYTSKAAFSENVLGRTYNAVKFMLAGGNPRNVEQTKNALPELPPEVVPDSAPQPVPPTTCTTAPAPNIKPDININVVASELIRDLESASRLAKLKAVVDSRQRLNPTLRRDLLRALNNANNNIADIEAQLSEDYEEIPNTGKAHQRLLERKPAQPNKYTFTIPPIKVLLAQEINGGVWCDPFAGMTSPAQVKNDLNPEANAGAEFSAWEK